MRKNEAETTFLMQRDQFSRKERQSIHVIHLGEISFIKTRVPALTNFSTSDGSLNGEETRNDSSFPGSLSDDIIRFMTVSLKLPSSWLVIPYQTCIRTQISEDFKFFLISYVKY